MAMPEFTQFYLKTCSYTPPAGKALLFLLLQGHGKARPQHSQTKSPSALSRFLNSYPWPTRALIRLARVC